MDIIPTETVESVAQHWKNQYFCQIRKGWSMIVSGISEGIYNRLVEASSLDECDEIIGNKTWTNSICEECEVSSREAKIVIGDKVHPFTICKQCLMTACATLEDAE